MERSYSGFHRSTIYKRIKRSKLAYAAKFGNEVSSGPSTSSAAADESSQAVVSSRLGAFEGVMRQEFAVIRHEFELMRKKHCALADDLGLLLCKMRQLQVSIADGRRPMPGHTTASDCRMPISTKEANGKFLQWSSVPSSASAAADESSKAGASSGLEPLEAVMRHEFATLHHEFELMGKIHDALAEDVSLLLCKMQQLGFSRTDSRRLLPAPTTAFDCPLPFSTKEGYEEFLQLLRTDTYCIQEMVKRLISVDGRNEKEVIRKLLSAILGPPLCLQFTWSRAGHKQAFVASPLYTVFSEAVRQHGTLRNYSEKDIHKTVIEWFHGSRDRRGGQRKRWKAAY